MKIEQANKLINKHENEDIPKINSQLEQKTKESLLLGKLLKKIKNDEDIITCSFRGDSITYGQAGDSNASDNRPAEQPHTLPRASKTYPEAMKEILDIVYGSTKFNMINRGYSGDTAFTSLNRWTTSVNSDVTFLMLGINDQVTSVPIEDFKNNYEKIIKQELQWNSALVLLTASKTGSGMDNINPYREVVLELGQVYGCPVIDMPELMKNYSANSLMPSDWTHLNTKGYTIMGTRLASLLIGEKSLNHFTVKAGTKLLNRRAIDNFHYYGNYELKDVATAPNANEGTYPMLINLKKGGSITYSFYAEEDDLIVIPVYSTNSTNIKWYIDFGIEQPQVSLSNVIDNVKVKPSIITPLRKDFTNSINDITKNDIESYMHISTKGYHTVTIKNESDTDSNCNFSGLIFLSYNDLLYRSIITYASEIPNVDGKKYTKGTTIYNTNPVAGGYIGWICTETGIVGNKETGLLCETQPWMAGIYVDKATGVNYRDRITIDGIEGKTFTCNSNIYKLESGRYQLEISPGMDATKLTNAIVRFAEPVWKGFGLIES